ncbi:hypothetical protein [Streptomyces corynorhini]|nr:hypothetical protein [Streptomyces corynorhini]
MDAGRLPDYPPKTPPPPKRPVQPPRPEPDTKPKSTLTPVRRRVMMARRRGVAWTLEAQPWSAGRARKHVVGKLHDWGYMSVDTVASDVVALLVANAVADGGRRISVHLADQDQQALVMVLSHQPGLTADESVLPRIAELGVSSCGTDTAEDGRLLWAVLDL